MSGYKLLIFQQEVRKTLRCAYCKLVMRDPVQTSKTGIRFCKECYYKAPRDSTNPEQNVWDDIAIKKEIAELLVQCPYHNKGCPWRGKLEDCDQHAAECEERNVILLSEPHQTHPSSSSSAEERSEQMEVGLPIISTEDVKLPLTHYGCKSCPHPPLNSSDFKRWITTELDAIKDQITELDVIKADQITELDAIKDRIIQLEAANASTYDGKFIWRISEIHRRVQDAKIGRITSIYSPPFYTGRNGYKMCIRAHLNGDGTGEGTHLSIFFVIMKGEYDPLLQWPFDHKVELILLDQNHKKHLVHSFNPSVQSTSLRQPTVDRNIISGFTRFASVSDVYNSYVKDDVMYIKAIVDTSKIVHP